MTGRAQGAPRGAVRAGEYALAACAVAGVLITVVYAVDPVERAVHAAPWLVGPALWVAAALGAGALLRRRPGRSRSGRAVLTATAVGGVADGLVVAAGHPWPGLATGIAVFAVTMAAWRGRPERRGARDRGPRRPRAAAPPGGRPGRPAGCGRWARASG